MKKKWLHTSNNSEVRVSQKLLRSLANPSYETLLKKEEFLKQSPDFPVYLDFSEKTTGRKTYSRDRYKLLEKF